MSYVSDLSQSQEYLSFRSNVPLKRIVVDADNAKGWRIYDCGPKNVRCPLVCLPPVSGTADIFYKQVLALSAKGIRVIAAESPVYWNVYEWCDGFRKLLDYLDLDKVHIFGCSLGGYLAQKFAEYTSVRPRVASLILCNTFTDTSIFNNHDSAAIFWILPALVLKKMIMGNFGSSKVDPEMVEAIDFMVERLETLPQTELASRLTLNCLRGYVQVHKLKDISVTIIDVYDESALSNSVREELYKCYPSAKLAHLKSGGNFPYLSRCAEVNLHLQTSSEYRQRTGQPVKFTIISLPLVYRSATGVLVLERFMVYFDETKTTLVNKNVNNVQEKYLLFYSYGRDVAGF